MNKFFIKQASDNSDLIELAKNTYLEDGQNQWPHIQRVLDSANYLADYRKKPLNRAETAAVLFHDIGKIPGNEVKGQDHGVTGSVLVRKLLRDRLKERQLIAVSNAIAAHNFDKPSKTKIADLLRSADANKQDLGWFLRKSYNKMTKRGLTHEQAIENAYNHLPNAVLDQLSYKPVLWQEAYKDQIKALREQSKKLKPNQVYRLIQKYNEEHPEESMYT